MSVKKKRILFTRLAILFIVLIICFTLSRISCKTYTCLTFPDNDKWTVKSIYEDTSSSWRGLISAPGYLVKLTVVPTTDPAQGALLTKTQLMGVNQIYADARSPYPGEISDRISCENKYKPHPKQMKTDSGLSVIYYNDYLNSSMEEGICVDDAIKYKGYTALFYCQSTKQWYQMELIVDKNSKKPDNYYTSLFSHIACH